MTQGTARRSGSAPVVAARSVLRVVASIVRIVTVVFAFVLVIHIVLQVAGANPVNAITVFFAEHARQLSLGVGDLFVPANESLRIILNFGLAAVIWLVVGIVVTKILAAFTP